MPTQLPMTMALDDSDTPSDVLDALILAAFTTGAQPFARSVRLQQVLADAPLLPRDGQVQRVVTEDGRRSHLAAGDGWTLRAIRWHGNSANVTVTATSDELADQVIKEATDGAEDVCEVPTDSVFMGFWHSTGCGPVRQNRRITTPAWSDIRRNYASGVAAVLADLMMLTPDKLTGRVLLLHGAPGTGKTTALRALAQAWSAWCQVDCVLDPEALFQNPGYLLEVAMGEYDEDSDAKWRLLVLEDCDELISASAKEASGQALSRLLNLSDGMLAQGRRVLIGLTTNESVSRLHPAIIRPGRCLAQIDVGPLPYAEACAWLGRAEGVGPHGATLAQLYALKDGSAQFVHAAPEPATGCYL